MSIAVGALILLLSCIGNAELWVVFVNRRHSLKYSHDTLRKIRSLHDFGLILFPPLIVMLAGFCPNGLLRGGSFGDLTWSVQWLLITTLLGLIPFAYSIIRWQLRRPPERLLESSSVTLDSLQFAENDAHRKSIIGKKTSRLAQLPFNQIYQLEVNRKRIRIESSSRPAHQTIKHLRLAHFSDVHLIGCPGKGFHDFVTDQLIELKPDAFIFTGDLVDQIDLLDWAMESFAKMKAVAPGYFILGNHDWHLDHAHIRNSIEDTGWINVAGMGRIVCIADIPILLAGTEAPWLGENPVVSQRSSEDLRLLLSHAPDQRDYAIANDFDMMLSGHNHGGQVILPLMGPVYSPSKFGVKYSGGVFQHRDMMIHVSRGVAAKDPLRWNCRPEITLLELQIH